MKLKKTSIAHRLASESPLGPEDVKDLSALLLNMLDFDPSKSTVGNRVDEIPRSDFSELCFLVFYLIVNTPTKKKSHHETPCCLPLFWYLPSKSKLCRICYSFFTAEGSTLEPNISSPFRILFNIYILVRKVF